MHLNELGWNEHFENSFEPYREQSLVPARIAVHQKDRYIVLTETGEYSAEVSGKFRFNASSRADFPTVGDWVAVTVFDDGGEAVIHELLPRKSKFSRKAVMAGGPKYGDGKTEEQVLSANVDTVLIVSGLDGEHNLRRIERYVAVTWNSGASPVILLNKCDLVENVDEIVSETESTISGVPVHAVSAKRRDGFENLAKYISVGKTVCFMGSSGVGKSTLINTLLGYDRQKTTEVRDYDRKGRHTTTYREMILLPDGGILIDTPGMREIQMWGEEGLSRAFDDIEEMAKECKFGNCTHKSEPGCKILEALDSGELDEGRYRNYLKLLREIERLDERKSGREAYLERIRGKKFANMVKEVKRLKGDKFKK